MYYMLFVYVYTGLYEPLPQVVKAWLLFEWPFYQGDYPDPGPDADSGAEVAAHTALSQQYAFFNETSTFGPMSSGGRRS